MPTFLFDKIVFGPVRSRRLGTSLGINLLPLSKKLCNFDCIYCECGWSHLSQVVPEEIPSRSLVAGSLEQALLEMKAKGEIPDVITYAGNGEPTLHPEFEGIAEDVFRIRNRVFPSCRISLLCNSALLFKPGIQRSLAYIDQSILKLDTAIDSTFRLMNRPSPGIRLGNIIEQLEILGDSIIIQTLFLRGKGSLSDIDNTTREEVDALIHAYKKIRPQSVMVYSFYRDTPTEELEVIGSRELRKIADRIEAEGIKVELTS